MKQWLLTLSQFAAGMAVLIILLAAYGTYAKVSIAVIITQAEE